MKISKIVLIIETVMMYLLHVPLWGIIVIAMFHANDSYLKTVSSNLGLVNRVSALILFVFAYADIFITMLNNRKIEGGNSEFTLIIKLVRIPWFIMNFVFCLLLSIGIVAGWMLPLLPTFLALAFLFSFLLCISSSLPESISFMKSMRKGEKELSVPNVILWVCLFVFVADVIASLLIVCNQKKEAVERK